MNLKTFEESGVGEEIRRVISELGFEHPMPVQEEVTPYLLGNRNDVIALAQIGTGKTAASGSPLLQRIDTNSKETQAIVFSPARELCLQIADGLKEFSKYIPHLHIVAIYGGAPIDTQIRQLRHGVQIIVTTPGRLIDLTHRGKACLDEVRDIVLDETDEMPNMGFQESITEILTGVPKDRNTLLLSVTMSREVERVARDYLHDYKEIVVGSHNEGAESVNHIYCMVNVRDKYFALKRLVDFYPKIYAIVFCRTKVETQEIADKLTKDGYNAEALHGDLSQQQRNLTMRKFCSHLTQILIATDIVARGLDVNDLTHVTNYGLFDGIENYIHHPDRTGRAGKKDILISIIHSREKYKVHNIEHEVSKDSVDGTLPSPEEIYKKQLSKAMDNILKTDVDEDQIVSYMKDINRQFGYIGKEVAIKKIVFATFDRFLDYYKNAQETKKSLPCSTREDSRGARGEGRGGRNRGLHKVESGYKWLLINLGKADGFYPGEVMQFINKNVYGKQVVGHIDLLVKQSYIEVPEQDAWKVMQSLDGVIYKGRKVRCDDAEEGGHGRSSSGRLASGNGRSAGDRGGYGSRGEGRRDARERKGRGRRQHDENPFGGQHKLKKDDWKELMKSSPAKLKGDEPDSSEEGWARYKPKK